MEDEEFQTVAMLGWEHIERLVKVGTPFLVVGDS
jgi:hypothetical protein